MTKTVLHTQGKVFPSNYKRITLLPTSFTRSSSLWTRVWCWLYYMFYSVIHVSGHCWWWLQDPVHPARPACRSLSWIMYIWLLFLDPKCKILHLYSLNDIWHFSDHWRTWSRSLQRVSQFAIVRTLPPTFVSWANFDKVDFNSASKFLIMIKRMGPSADSCGTPQVTGSHKLFTISGPNAYTQSQIVCWTLWL